MCVGGASSENNSVFVFFPIGTRMFWGSRVQARTVKQIFFGSQGRPTTYIYFMVLLIVVQNSHRPWILTAVFCSYSYIMTVSTILPLLWKTLNPQSNLPPSLGQLANIVITLLIIFTFFHIFKCHFSKEEKLKAKEKKKDIPIWMQSYKE